jgi:acetolactate synthase-1/2/3 large subunit
VACTPPGQIASLILPADVSWSPAPDITPPPSAATSPVRLDDSAIARIAAVLESGEPTVLLMNGAALHEPSLMAAERIARKTGARLFTDTFTARTPRGAGRPLLSRLGYFAEQALRDLQGTRHLILVGTKAPVAFFAYPDKPGSLVPEGCQVHAFAGPEVDCSDALARLAERVSARTGVQSAGFTQLARPALPTGALSSQAVGAAIAALMPEHAIIVDEGNTEGFATSLATLTGPPHDWLHNTGGSIGLGLPQAIGAAIACPDRKVICLEGDGSAMYTNQALWTMAREQLDITVIVFANRSYRILSIELGRVGAASSAGPRTRELLSLTRPELDFVALSHSMGVPASRPEDAAALSRELEHALAEPGPHVIECRV